MAKFFGENGVSEKKTNIVYDEGSIKYTGGVHFLLKYLGAPNVKALNGGHEAWKAGRKAVTKNPTNICKTTFNAKANNSFIVGMADVKAAKGKGNVALVDTREVTEFKGIEDKSTGHLTGAVNLNHNLHLDAKGMVKPNADLEKMLIALGITKGKEIILYCSTVVRAGKEYLILTSILGYNKMLGFMTTATTNGKPQEMKS